MSTSTSTSTNTNIETPPAANPPDRHVRVATPEYVRKVGRGCRVYLERVIAEHAAALGSPGPDHLRRDMTIYFGDRIAAVIRRSSDGRAEVLRFF